MALSKIKTVNWFTSALICLIESRSQSGRVRRLVHCVKVDGDSKSHSDLI